MQSVAPTEQKPTRSLFWLAFAIGFVLLAAVSCGGAAALVGLDNFTLSDFQSSDPLWTPPPIPASQSTENVAVAPADANPQPGSLQAGSTARNVASSRVNIRRSPGYLGKGDDDILAQMEPGAAITILEGPQATDDLRWWRIRYDGPAGSAEGWVAESTASGVQILGAD